MKLTEAQKRELRHLIGGRSNNINYFVGESLRKRGLVERYTTYLTGADFADKDGVTVQFRGKQTRHEWWITVSGRAALQERDNA